MTLIITVFIIIVVAAGAYFAWKIFSEVPEAPAPVPEEQAPVVDDTTVYTSPSMKFSITYPRPFAFNESYTNTSVNPQKPISGVKFTIPLTAATGTTLASDTGISVEQLPRAKICTGDIFLAANVKSHAVTEGVTEYSVATSSETTADNIYEEMIYAIASSSPCTAVRYYIHSTPAGSGSTLSPFDHAGLVAAFDRIRQSLVLQ